MFYTLINHVPKLIDPKVHWLSLTSGKALYFTHGNLVQNFTLHRAMNRYEIAGCFIPLSPCRFRDPILYPDYDDFRPGRFLDAFERVNASENISDMPSTTQAQVVFGFGKR